jgi:predicted nucleotidyltransferase
MSSPPPPFDFSRLHARQAREQAEAVAIAAQLAALVLERVPPILRRYGAGRAWLFGSVAAGRCHGRSDVDLLVLGIAAADYWALRHDLEQASKTTAVDDHTFGSTS